MRILLSLLFSFWCIWCQAQIRLGVEGGYSRVTWASIHPISSIYLSDNSYTTSGQDGFQAGMVAEIKLSRKLFLRPALHISGKGTILNFKSSLDTSSRGIWIQYFEVPVSVVYQVSLCSKVKGFAGAGLYAAEAYDGIERGKGRDYGGAYLIYDRVVFGKANKNPSVYQTLPTITRPFDYGFTVLVGIEVKNLQLLLTYSRGLKSLLPTGEPYNGNYTNSGLTVSAAYLIKTKL